MYLITSCGIASPTTLKSQKALKYIIHTSTNSSVISLMFTIFLKIFLTLGKRWFTITRIEGKIFYIISRKKVKVRPMAHVVPFHGITFPYRWYKEVWIFAPIYLVFLDDVLLWIRWTDYWKRKVCWRRPSMFCLYTSTQNSNVDSHLQYGELIP